MKTKAKLIFNLLIFLLISFWAVTPLLGVRNNDDEEEDPVDIVEDVELELEELIKKKVPSPAGGEREVNYELDNWFVNPEGKQAGIYRVKGKAPDKCPEIMIHFMERESAENGVEVITIEKESGEKGLAYKEDNGKELEGQCIIILEGSGPVEAYVKFRKVIVEDADGVETEHYEVVEQKYDDLDSLYEEEL